MSHHISFELQPNVALKQTLVIFIDHLNKYEQTEGTETLVVVWCSAVQ